MTLAPIQREKIYDALISNRKNYGGTQTDFCKTWDINPSAFSQIKAARAKSEVPEKVISDDKLVRIGRKLQVSFSSAPVTKTEKTEVYEYLHEMLDLCQQHSAGRIFVDIADLGKSFAAKDYILNRENAFYVQCDQHKGRTEFIRALARATGASTRGSLKDVYRDTIYMIQSMDKPVIVLDEAGDLAYTAFLEIKAYWNALEGCCGWLMMGADGLAKKMDANITNKKVGYTEILRRFGGEYMSYTKGMSKAEIAQLKLRIVNDVAEANVPKGYDVRNVIKNSLSPTRVIENIRKVIPNEMFQAA